MKGLMTIGLWLFFCAWMPRCGNTAATDANTAALQQKTSTATSSSSERGSLVIPAAGLQVDDVRDTSITLRWAAASDAVTPANQLTYLAYYTSQAPDTTSVLTEEQVTSNWNAVGSATAGLTSVEAMGLSSDTMYYFTVLVSNSAGEAALYPVKEQATSVLPDTITELTTVTVTSTRVGTGLGPTVTMGAPSSTNITVAGSSVILFTYVASVAGDTTLTGTLNAAGGGITTTALTGNPSCTVTVRSITTAGGSILLSSCTGNGMITVHVNAGTAEDAAGNPSVVSLESDGVLIDNTAPTIVSLTPSTSIVNPTPTTVIASFSKPVSPISASAFTVSGCSVTPTKGAVQMSTDRTTATLSLSGGTCGNTQALTVSLDPTAITDLIGNIGSGSISTATYTVSTVGPSASMGTPSSTLVKSSATATIALTYTASSSGGTALTGTLMADGGGVTVTTVSGSPSCTVGVSGITVSGATISLSSCSGNGTLTVHVNASTVKDRLHNMSTASPESAVIIVDNTAPTVSSASPSTGSAIFAIPSSITVNFSEAVNASFGDFSLSSSTCDTNPNIDSISGAGTSSIVVTIGISGICTGSQSIVLVTTLSGITDLAGNVGSGTNAVTLSFAKRIFFTSGTHNGDFATGFANWRAGADAFCANDGNKPSTGTYKAMMTDGSTRLACTTSNCSGGASEHTGKDWVLASSAMYTRPDGTVIKTTTSAGIFSFNLTNLIASVGGYNVPGTAAWTGMHTDKNWLADTSNICNSWSSAASDGSVLGNYGTTSDANGNSIGYSQYTCSTGMHLYCVEQ